LWQRTNPAPVEGKPMRNWIPVLVFASVALTVYFVLIPKPRRPERRWSSDGGDIGLSSESSGSGWSFADWFSSDSSSDGLDGGSSDSGSSDSGGDGGGGDGGGGGD
jgi:hypothetical protein